MTWTNDQIKKVIQKFESVELHRELENEDTEITLEVFYSSTRAEKAYFDAMRGEGHPGAPGEIEIILVLDPNKIPVDLTESETERALDRIRETLEDEGDDFDDLDEYDDDDD